MIYLKVLASFVGTVVLSWGLWIAMLALACTCDETRKGGNDEK